MYRRRRDSFELFPLAVSTAWGWSLELGLASVTLFVLREVARFAGEGGRLLLFGLVGISLWRFPRARAAAVRELRDNSTRRWLTRGLRIGWTIGHSGDYVALGRVTMLPVGPKVRARVPRGEDVSLLDDRAPAIANALRIREVRVLPDPANASIVELVAVRHDPLTAKQFIAWEWRDAEQTSLLEPVPVGLSEDGEAISIGLIEHNLLIGGEPGAGKSVAMQLLVAAAALDPTVKLTLLDGKQVELAPWEWCAEHFVGPNLDHAIAVLEELVSELDTRYTTLLASGRRKIGPGDHLGPHLVAIDELAYFLQSGERSQRSRIEELLRDLISRGRAAGMILVAATQKPSADVIPTSIRDLFSYRLALRCTSPEASNTILGQGWASQGYTAQAIAPSARGVGLLLAEGSLPVRIKLAYLDDEEIRTIAARAAVLRAGL